MRATLGTRDFSAYCARVEVRPREGVVLHHVDIEKSPNLVGIVRKRFYSFDPAGRLGLRVEPSELTAPVVSSILVWERIAG